MSKRNQLITTTNLVKSVLEIDPQTRNSDSLLYLKVLEHIAIQKDIDLQHLTVPAFLLSISELGFPCFETVRRTRQKIQADFPDLQSVAAVREQRQVNEAVFKSYANGGIW